jgi:hypothetical protein
MTSKALRLSGLAKELDALAAASSSTLVVYEYTATANQTVFSGVDNNGLTLNYIGPNTLVVYNEGMLQKTVDYATTSSSVLTLQLGAEAGALVRMYAFGTFAVANVYTKAEADAAVAAVATNVTSLTTRVGTLETLNAKVYGSRQIGSAHINPASGQEVLWGTDCLSSGITYGGTADRFWNITNPGVYKIDLCALAGANNSGITLTLKRSGAVTNLSQGYSGAANAAMPVAYQGRFLAGDKIGTTVSSGSINNDGVTVPTNYFNIIRLDS